MEGTKVEEFVVGDKILYSGKKAKIVGEGPSPNWFYITYKGEKCRYLAWGGYIKPRY